jgi:CRISPR-associated protein Csx14
MAESRIPVDLFNPGQVFACLGFLEAAEVLLGEAEGGFDWGDPEKVVFVLRARGEAEPLQEVLRFLEGARVSSITPPGSELDTAKWQVPRIEADGQTFPFPEPESPAILPALMEGADGRRLTIEHWGDASRRDTIKFWAGSGGYPGAALARDALDLVRQHLLAAGTAVFDIAAPQSSSFRFDWRRDYVPLGVGFSPNEHAEITMVGYPAVELLAAIGMQNARPARPDRRDRLTYVYAVPGGCLPPLLLRAALGAADLPFPRRVFRMRLDWPGQEGQARCITDVIEETPP